MTITTIATYRLVSESFKNWRGMTEFDGRRIRRALHVDQATVRFLDAAQFDGQRHSARIDDYLEARRRELEACNASLATAGKEPVSMRRGTNLGAFRAYVETSLRTDPRIHQDMTLRVRQLAPGPTGMPLEICCFTTTTDRDEYEAIQADIFDHLLAVLPEFGLRVFQEQSSSDVTRVMIERGNAAVRSLRP